MITKIKEIKEIMPETLDYILMDENELYTQGEKLGELIYITTRKKTEWEKIDESLKRSAVAAMQYCQFHSAMQTMKRKNKKCYDKLMQDLRDKKRDAKIDIDYFESITSGRFMQSIKASYTLYKNQITASASK